MKIVYSMGIDTDGMSAPPSMAPGSRVRISGNVRFLCGLLFIVQDSQVYEMFYRGSDNLGEFLNTWSLQ